MSDGKHLIRQVQQAVAERLDCSPESIRPDQKFFADLGLGSIDLLVLGDRLDQQLGKPLRFGEALANWAQAGYDDVTIGEIAALVELQLAAADSAG